MQKQTRDKGKNSVVRLFANNNANTEQPTLVEQLQYMLDMAVTGQIDNMLMVCYNHNAEVLTGYVNLTPRERMALTSYLQTDLISDIVVATERG